MDIEDLKNEVKKAVSGWIRRNRRILVLAGAAAVAILLVVSFEGTRWFGMSRKQRYEMSEKCGRSGREFLQYLDESKRTLPVSSILKLRETRSFYNPRMNKCYTLVVYDVEGGTVSELYDLNENKKIAEFNDYPNPLGTTKTWSFGNVLDKDISTIGEFRDGIKPFMEE